MGAGTRKFKSMLQCVAVRCRVLQCVAVCCSVLQCEAMLQLMVCVLYNLSHLRCHFQKLFPELESKACRSLLPNLSENKPTSFGFELWFRDFANDSASLVLYLSAS